MVFFKPNTLFYEYQLCSADIAEHWKHLNKGGHWDLGWLILLILLILGSKYCEMKSWMFIISVTTCLLPIVPDHKFLKKERLCDKIHITYTCVSVQCRSHQTFCWTPGLKMQALLISASSLGIYGTWKNTWTYLKGVVFLCVCVGLVLDCFFHSCYVLTAQFLTLCSSVNRCFGIPCLYYNHLWFELNNSVSFDHSHSAATRFFFLPLIIFPINFTHYTWTLFVIV